MGNLWFFNVRFIVFHIVPLQSSHCLLLRRFYGVVRPVAIPLLCKNLSRSVFIKDDPLSKCTYASILEIENNLQNFLTTDLVSTFQHASANQNVEKSLTIVKLYLLLFTEGGRPLNSMLIHWSGCRAFTRRTGSGWNKRGLHSLQMGKKDFTNIFNRKW